jgi:NitT/TauT family transport system permease protein/taurine transport system permease protein
VVAGAILGSIPLLRRIFLPMLSSVYAIPLVIVYPVLTVWFGIEFQSKVILGSFYGFFPAMLAAAAAAHTVPPEYLIVADSMGATRMQKMWRVMLPASVPIVLSGIRLGGALAIVGVVVAEMLVSSAGLGHLISYYRLTMATPRVFVAIFLVLVVTLLFDIAVRALERVTASWRPEFQEMKTEPVM